MTRARQRQALRTPLPTRGSGMTEPRHIENYPVVPPVASQTMDWHCRQLPGALVVCEREQLRGLRHGDQWTGLHLTMAKLVALGIGIGMVEYQLPREVWDVLPGGVPYFIVKDQTPPNPEHLRIPKVEWHQDHNGEWNEA